MDTSGFYKLADNNEILFAPNFVHMPGRSLTRDDESDKIDSYNGWQWYDTQDAAFTALNQIANSDTITPMQAKLALYNAGLLDTVLGVVSQSDSVAQIAWENAEVFKRSSPLLNSLAASANISDAQLDALFLTAKQIVV